MNTRLTVAFLMFLVATVCYGHGWDNEDQTYEDPRGHDDEQFRHFHAGGNFYSCRVEDGHTISVPSEGDAVWLHRAYQACSNVGTTQVRRVCSEYGPPDQDEVGARECLRYDDWAVVISNVPPPPPEPVVEPVVPEPIVVPKPIVNITPVPQPTPLVIYTPTPVPQPTVVVETEVPTPEPEIIPEPIVTTQYTMVFPEGVSLLHLPIISQDITHFTALFGALGDNVNVIAGLRSTVMLWSVITSSPSPHDEWISSSRGFLVDMETQATLELIAVQRPYGYSMMYLNPGMNLVGVPRQSEALQTVGDFYRRFPGVTSVKGLDTDIDFMLPIQDDWFVELDRDTAIDGTTGYMIESGTDSQYPVWGTQWTVTASAAPGVAKGRRSIVTSWGAIKAQ